MSLGFVTDPGVLTQWNKEIPYVSYMGAYDGLSTLQAPISQTSLQDIDHTCEYWSQIPDYSARATALYNNYRSYIGSCAQCQ